MSDMPVHPVKLGRMAPCLAVRDIDAACAFYETMLGLRKVFENGSPTGFVILKRDEAELHLSLQREHRASTMNVVHVFVDDVVSLHASFQAAGVRIVKALREQEYGQKAFVFADPDGNRIDVGERTR